MKKQEPVDDRQSEAQALRCTLDNTLTELKQARQALEESEARFQMMADSTPLMIWVAGPDGGCTYFNQRWLEFTGRTLEQELGYGWAEGLHPEDRDHCLNAYAQAFKARELFTMEYRLKRFDGVYGWVLDTGGPRYLPDGTFAGYIGGGLDITERKEAEDRLWLAARVFESTAEGIVITDPDTTILAVNKAFTNITGYMAEEAIGRKMDLLKSGCQEAEFYRAMWDSIHRTGQWCGEIWDRRKDGEVYPRLLTISAVKNNQGEVINYIGTFSDLSSIKEAQRQLEYLANYDDLTRLPNRRLFSDRLSHALDRARRHETQLAVMLIDLDNFKVINDTLGHDRGDRLLQAVADRLMECVRQEDTLARLGGDEFTVLLETLTGAREVARTAERIIKALSAPFRLDDHEITITASLGISVYPSDGQDLQSLMKNADTAMYRAKAQGKNYYQFFTADLHAQVLARLTLETGLRRALKRGELFLLYQPLVEIATGRTVGMEALLRWQHPHLGVLLPDKFVPLAEETGLIVPIGKWVIETACRQVQSWTQAGLSKLRMAVNLSPRQFRQMDLGRVIEQALYKTGVSPSCLELELTEQAVMEDVEAASRVLHELKALGIGLAIDDFGTGYSSLAQLKRFPLDRLKIDRSFVQDVATDSFDAAITQAIITMAHILKLKVLAEGVETLEQLRFLEAQGCDEAQGYYFQSPAPL